MKRIALALVLTILPFGVSQQLQAQDEMDAETIELLEAQEADSSASAAGSTQKAGSRKKTFTKAETFVAGEDWEFDGFVASGQDSRIKSMYILNDLIYLNIGSEDGIEPGDRLSIYRRGDKVRDPQTGRFLGYEVRRAAISEVTNKVNDNTCAARIMVTYEGVEVGDLVRKDNE